MTNTDTLLTLIGKSPMMRTVQIADRLDMSVDEADAQLRLCVQAGHIIEHEVDAPNNRKAMAYELSAQYMAANSITAAPRATALTSKQIGIVAERSAPSIAATAGREPTKVERAIAFVRMHGPSSSAQLHAELGLAEGVHVSSYLGSAVRTGRMVRDGNTWSLPSAGTVAPADIPKFSTIRSAPPASESAPQEQLNAAAEPAPHGAGTPTAFRCALWSDGTFEIQRNGATIASLHPSEHSTVIDTLQRERAA